MPQNQDVYVRVGRGGAGNFHSSKPNPSKDANKDLEAAKPQQITPPSPPPPSSLARAGRGGAGNYADSNASFKKEQELAGETVNAVAASAAAHPRGALLGGRGGAGNWKTDELTARKLDEEQRIGLEMERKAIEAVNVELKMPEKAHHAPLTTK
ncbi:unnamed protein product [Clonostachys chloroleuca]|uniref:Uncharacterized protein n=1 Tax=Clonostachys chloroleuca TaxID=1926264 RepID=A0AA35M7Q4_9HYPO|nr:unnamed protein product [Clonostachys chloroleuca]